MFRMILATSFAVSLLAAQGCTAASANAKASISENVATTADLAALAQGAHRSAANVARNPYRHPVETLELFGLHPHMKVIELWPGTGWYSEIIAPYLKEGGQFTAASFDVSPPPESNAPAFRARLGQQYLDKLAAEPDLYRHTKVIAFDPPRLTSLGVESSADMVLTFRNLHNWAQADALEAVFRSVFEVLSPGGVFGVVEHRAAAGMPLSSGYMEQQAIIDLAKSVGFRLALTSEINANPKDTKDHPKGVWTLPPTLRLAEQDKAKYLAIGESDRMTLKFYKPDF